MTAFFMLLCLGTADAHPRMAVLDFSGKDKEVTQAFTKLVTTQLARVGGFKR